MKPNIAKKNKSLFLFLIFLLGIVSHLNAQIINTYAGIGPSGGAGSGSYSGDGGPATAAGINEPGSLKIDSLGNLYFADIINFVIRKVDPYGIITTFAGNGTGTYAGDGIQATATGIVPAGIQKDRLGNVYFIDKRVNIRKVNTSGIITTIAGTGTMGNSGDGGPATAAEINAGDMAMDQAGNLYLADGLYIRKIDATGTITTIAGNGTAGYSGDGGPATAAMINTSFIAVDRIGNLYLSVASSKIRKINTSGIITTIAGGDTTGYFGDGGPATSALLNSPHGISVDNNGNLYIADYVNYRIRKVDTLGIITTVAGNGIGGFSGDGGPADSAELSYLDDVNVAGNGDFYISDSYNNRIRKVQINPESVLFFGNATNDINIYPNPVNHQFKVITSSGQEAHVVITNMEGVLVQEQIIPASNQPATIKLNAPNGVYMVRVVTDKGSVVKKVVVME